MAVSTVAGGSRGGVSYTCILKEGNTTYSARGYGPDGYRDEVNTFQTEIYKGEYVMLSTDTANTYAATGGLPVVIPLSNGTFDIGIVESEPKWVAAPPTSSQSTWSTQLSSKYYRVATVRFLTLNAIEKAVLVGASAGNLVPGVGTTLKVDASASNALGVADGVITLSCADAASGGSSALIPMTYVASGSATVSLLVGFTGGPVVIQA